MTRILCSDFEQFFATLPGQRGHCILRTRQTGDWRLRMIDLNGITVMTGREAAGRVYNGVKLQDCFNVSFLLGTQYAAAIDGKPFDGRRIAWFAPGRMFHTTTDGPTRWLSICISGHLVRQWAGTHQDEFDDALLDNCFHQPVGPIVCFAGRAGASDPSGRRAYSRGSACTIVGALCTHGASERRFSHAASHRQAAGGPASVRWPRADTEQGTRPHRDSCR